MVVGTYHRRSLCARFSKKVIFKEKMTMKQPLKLNDQKYCSWCGSELEWNKDFAVCSGCAKHQFLNPRPCTAVFVIYNHRVLLLKRSIEPKIDLLDLPGGFVDVGDESMERGALRELKEETSLLLNESELKYLGSSLYKGYIYQGIQIPTMTSYFIASVTRQQAASIQLDHENSEYFWIDINKIAKEDLACETYWLMIDKLKALINNVS